MSKHIGAIVLAFCLICTVVAYAADDGEVFKSPVPQFLDYNGKPLSGGKLYTYDAGTTNARSLYSDEACTTAVTNPVTLNARGEPASTPLYATGTYKVVLKTSSDVTVWTADNVKFWDIDTTAWAEANLLNKSSITDVTVALNLGTASGLDAGQAANNVLLVTETNKLPRISAENLYNLNVYSATHYPPGYISGLRIANSTTTANTKILVYPGVARSASNELNIDINSPIEKSIDSSYVVGYGNGGMVAGQPRDVSTWYAVWVTLDRTALTSDVIISYATSRPDIASHAARRIGFFMTDESNNIKPFYQNGDKFYWKYPQPEAKLILSASGVENNYTFKYAPPYSRLEVDFALSFYPSAVDNGLVLYSPELVDYQDYHDYVTTGEFSLHGIWTAPPYYGISFFATLANHSANDSRDIANVTMYLPNAKLGLTTEQGASLNMHLGTYGWKDNRGKDDPFSGN